MQTLTYGYQLPQTGDKGPQLFSALGQNIQSLNDHTHDGVNSAPIARNNIKGVIGNALSTNWASFGGAVGEFRQLLPMAAGFIFDTTSLSVRTMDGQYAYPKILKNNDTSFYIYTNDPTVSFKVVYGG